MCNLCVLNIVPVSFDSIKPKVISKRNCQVNSSIPCTRKCLAELIRDFIVGLAKFGEI